MADEEEVRDWEEMALLGEEGTELSSALEIESVEERVTRGGKSVISGVVVREMGGVEYGIPSRPSAFVVCSKDRVAEAP